MKYAKHLDLPNFAKHRQSLIDYRKTLGDELWIPLDDQQAATLFPELVKDLKDSFGATVLQLIFFSIPQNDPNVTDSENPKSIFIHTDSYNEEHMKYDAKLAINLPLENCEGTSTIFYDYIFKGPLVWYPVFTATGIRHQHVEEVARVEISKPTLIRINIPHGVHNPHKYHRLVATIRFKEDLEHLLEEQSDRTKPITSPLGQ